MGERNYRESEKKIHFSPYVDGDTAVETPQDIIRTGGDLILLKRPVTWAYPDHPEYKGPLGDDFKGGRYGGAGSGKSGAFGSESGYGGGGAGGRSGAFGSEFGSGGGGGGAGGRFGSMGGRGGINSHGYGSAGGEGGIYGSNASGRGGGGSEYGSSGSKLRYGSGPGGIGGGGGGSTRSDSGVYGAGGASGRGGGGANSTYSAGYANSDYAAPSSRGQGGVGGSGGEHPISIKRSASHNDSTNTSNLPGISDGFDSSKNRTVSIYQPQSQKHAGLNAFPVSPQDARLSTWATNANASPGALSSYSGGETILIPGPTTTTTSVKRLYHSTESVKKTTTQPNGTTTVDQFSHKEEKGGYNY